MKLASGEYVKCHHVDDDTECLGGKKYGFDGVGVVASTNEAAIRRALFQTKRV
jgi:hypothetical protein